MKKDEEINFDSPLSINDVIMLMDGGTVVVECIDNQNREFSIFFNQKLIFEVREELNTPCRLRLNNQLVDIRSELEEKILNALLPMLNWRSKLGRKEKNLLKECISYLRSDQFLKDCEKSNKKITEPNNN